MKHPTLTPSGEPFDIHERLLLFACDVVDASQFLHKRGGIARAHFLINWSRAERPPERTPKKATAAPAGRTSSPRTASRCDPLVQESGELVKILAAIVHNARRNLAAERAKAHEPFRH